MGEDQVEYLGYLITAESSCPLPEKVEAINNYKMPDTIHELRTFLGMINFYRRYLKNAAKTKALLHDLMKGAKEKDPRKVPWAEGIIKISNSTSLILLKLVYCLFLNLDFHCFFVPMPLILP
ncbi:retrovirus-related Pol polyprotein from transposon opus [Nephila pilipes]|uniref:Retrovirus-related Pol polyprotein from transposon opus n=1 Tax=Nephila pilipes TaxID=299642 RepID=A0A8X6MWZ4_NEPPI|nr:retrovirus-related Pol polyprotein from transposon opus [Nephila pilipes]